MSVMVLMVLADLRSILPREAHVQRRTLGFLLHSTHTQTHFSVWEKKHVDRNMLGIQARKWEGRGRTLLLFS